MSENRPLLMRCNDRASEIIRNNFRQVSTRDWNKIISVGRRWRLKLFWNNNFILPVTTALKRLCNYVITSVCSQASWLCVGEEPLWGWWRHDCCIKITIEHFCRNRAACTPKLLYRRSGLTLKLKSKIHGHLRQVCGHTSRVGYRKVFTARSGTGVGLPVFYSQFYRFCV